MRGLKSGDVSRLETGDDGTKTRTSQGTPTPQEGLEEHRAPQRVVLGNPVVAVPVRPPGEVGAKRDVDQQRNDLGRQTGDHDIDAGVLQRRAAVGARGHGPADGLQQQSEEVAGDEQNAVGTRLQAREVLAVDDDDAAETQVDGGAQEGRADGQGDDLAVRR